MTLHRCPECGGREHLYGRSDCHWDFKKQEWVVGDMEDEIDCTECDWTGPLSATFYEEA